MTTEAASLSVEGGQIIARTPFYLKDTLKSVPGAKWDVARRTWVFPASHITAVTLDTRLPSLVVRAETFTALLAAAEDEARKQEVKTRDDLPDVPVSAKPAWMHQRQAYWFSHEKRAAMLAMDMGTGKTKVTLDLIQNSDDELILIVAPAKVVEDGLWGHEVTKHVRDADQWQVVELRKGTIERRAEALRQHLRRRRQGERLAFVINYEAVWRGALGKEIKGVQWDRVVCDESHRIKSPTGSASKFMAELTARSRRRLALTGTPMPHSPLDVFAQYRFLDPGIYGTSFFRFKHEYARWGGFGGYQLMGYKNEDELNARFYSIAFRVMADDVLDLPETQHLTRTAALDGQALRIYRELHREFVSWVEEGVEVTATNALTKLLRLAQVTSGFLPVADDRGERVNRTVSTAKQELLADVFEDLPLEEPVVVFARFQYDLDAIRAAAEQQGRTCAELSGRRNDLQAWKDGRYNVLAVQIQAGGVGVDLTRARYCVYYSVGYSLGDYLQSVRRVHRPGQTRPTFYYHLLIQGTVDEAVYAALDARQEVVQEILSELKL